MRYRPYAIIAGFLILYAGVAYRTPYGGWDAFAIWNATARLIIYHDPMTVFQLSGMNHKDYPPLLPLTISYGFRVFGDNVLVPIILHGLLFAAVLYLIRKPTWLQAVTGIIILPYAASQFADLPLALAFLCAAVAYRHNKPLWVGAALGIAVLVKNEGALIALSFFAVWIIGNRRIPWKAIAAFAPFAVCLLLFRVVVNIPNDVVGATGILQRLTDFSRYAVMLPLLLQGIITFGGGGLALLVVIIILRREQLCINVPQIAAGVVLAGYIGTYAITPYDVTWHIVNSFDRLLLHLLPVTLYSIVQCSN